TRLRLRRIGDGAGACNSRRPRHNCATEARPVGCSSRYFPYRGIRLPIHGVYPLEVNQFNRRTIERAIAAFEPSHPYLLFRKDEIGRIRSASKKNRKVWARLHAALHETKSASVKGETRQQIKRRARRLINTSFLAMMDDSHESHMALQITRDLLQDFISAPSWRYRPIIRSFLDCAEIAVAVSLAYDWLYDKLLPVERREIEQSLLKNVLEPALLAYEDRALQWPKRRDNCALVSNSGIILAS